MDITTTNSLITGCLSLASGIGGILLKSYLDNRAKPLVSPERQRTLSGEWRGSFVQKKTPIGVVRGTLIFQLTAKKRDVSGKCTLSANWGANTIETTFSVRGRFLHSYYLMLDYENVSDPGAVHFGQFVLKLSDDGTELSGLYEGYGKKSKCLVHGTISMKKHTGLFTN